MAPRFLTLTAPPGERVQVSWDQLTARFQRLRQRVERRYGIKLEYAGVVEVTKRGVPHLHVIFRGPWVRQAEWSRLAAAVGYGPIVDIRRVTSAGVASYAGKSLGGYLSKSFAASYPAHVRRVRFSREWAPEWAARPVRAATEGPGAGQWVLLRSGDPRLAGFARWWLGMQTGQGPPDGGEAQPPDP